MSALIMQQEKTRQMQAFAPLTVKETFTEVKEKIKNHSDTQSANRGIDDEETAFYDELGQYPSLFLSEKVHKLNFSRLKSVLDRLQRHIDSRGDEDEFTAFDVNDTTLLNFSVFLLWSLGREEEAVPVAENAVQQHSASIIAYGNLAYIRWMRDERTEARDELRKMERMKSDSEELFRIAEEQADEELIYCYTNLGLEFIEIATIVSKKAIERWPENEKIKFSCAITLKRSTHNNYTSIRPGVDCVRKIRTAIGIFSELKDNENATPTMRALAAAELGDILLNQYDRELYETVQGRVQALGLSTRDCYEQAISMDSNNPNVLCHAGKFFRFKKDHTRSLELLRKAVSLRPNSKNHHQLGLTLKKMARRINSQRYDKQKMLLMKSPLKESFSRHDRNAKESMEHFCKAVEVSHGDNKAAVYDLGLMHRALGENDEALDKFHQILKRNLLSQYVLGAFEQSGLVYKCMGWSILGEQSRVLVKISHAMFIVTLCCQSRLVYTIRSFGNQGQHSEIWQSLFTLRKYILNDCSVPSGNSDPQEDWLLNLIHRYAEDLQVLRDVFGCSNSDSRNPQFLKARLQEYMDTDRHEDAMLFLCLLKLTDQWQALSSHEDVDTEIKIYVCAARSRLQEAGKHADHLMDKFNEQAAKWIFSWAFIERFNSVIHQQDKRRSCGMSPGTGLQDAAVNSDSADYAYAAGQPKDQDVGECLVVLLHDLQGASTEHNVACVQSLFEDVFGLRLICIAPRVERYAAKIAVRSASLTIVVCSEGLSPEFEQCVRSVLAPISFADVGIVSSSVAATTAEGNVAVVCLEDAPLPTSFQHYRAVSCPRPDLILDRSEARVDILCNFFCQLLEIDMKF